MVSCKNMPRFVVAYLLKVKPIKKELWEKKCTAKVVLVAVKRMFQKRLIWKRIQMVQKSRFTSSVNVKSMEDMFRFLETKRIHVFSCVTVRMRKRR